MIKLDLYDRKILEVLLDNSRVPVTKIAKKIKLRRENIIYRINRLIKNGLIRNFNTIFNEELLGLEHYVFFLQITNIKKESEKLILKKLLDHPYITWLGTCAGKWSIVFDVITKRKKLEAVIKDILSKLDDFIEDYVVLKLEKHEHYNFKLLELNKKQNIKEYNKKEFTKIDIDKTDLKIIDTLNNNSRASYVDISKDTNLTPNSIHNHLKKLEKEEAILGYTISLNWKELGYEWYGLQFKMLKFDKDTEKKVTSYLRESKNIIFYYRYLGSQWDYDIGVVVKNSNELRDFINELRSNFSNKIKISDVFIVLDQLSDYKLPRGVFD